MFDKNEFEEALDREFYEDCTYKWLNRDDEMIDVWIERYFQREMDKGTIMTYSVIADGTTMTVAAIDSCNCLYHDMWYLEDIVYDEKEDA